jgi:hypothetical protein
MLLKAFGIVLLELEDSRDPQWGLPGLLSEEIMSLLLDFRSYSSHVIETRKRSHFEIIGISREAAEIQLLVVGLFFSIQSMLDVVCD